jgi:hypothetical protein
VTWLALEEGRVPPAIERANTWLRVWRRGFHVTHRTMTPLEADAFAGIAAEESFADLCERLEKACGPDAAATAVQLLDGWLSDGLIADGILGTRCNGGRPAATQA